MVLRYLQSGPTDPETKAVITGGAEVHVPRGGGLMPRQLGVDTNWLCVSSILELL